MILPVIERELRSAARQRFTYTLRMLGVVALLGSLLSLPLALTFGAVGALEGRALFARFHATLFWAIWILVPVASADCISRERREGTLGLLFLTPLTQHAIVYAKSLVQGLRALTLWLAVLPVLTLSLLAGGVGWTDVLISAMVNLSSMALAMGAGLVASAFSTVWSRSLGLAALLSVSLLGFFLWNSPGLIVGYTGTGPWVPPTEWGFTERLMVGWYFLLNTDGVWQNWPSRIGAGTVGTLLVAFLLLTLLSLLFFLLLVGFCAWRLRADREERAPSALSLELKRTLFTPVIARNVLRTWLNYELRHNPVGWLERRSWSGRLVMWSWFAIVACVYSSLFSNLNLYQHAFHRAQVLLATLLAGSIAFSAAGSFRRERETGVLELLLVAPMREWDILSGRVRGLWSQFLPAIALLCAVWLYGSTFLSTVSALPSVLLYLVTFATTPVVGLYFSLARSNFLAALLWTLGVQVFTPLLLVGLLDFLRRYTYTFTAAGGAAVVVDSALNPLLVVPAVQVAIALLLGWRLHANLNTRAFLAAQP